MTQTGEACIMKITAIDLTHRKFARSFRGYRPQEVDDLLRELAAELEESARDRARMQDQIERLHAEVARYREMEQTLNNAVLLAQKTADEVQASARRDADSILREAEIRAERLNAEAHRQRQDLLNEIRRLQERRDQLEDALRCAARDLLEWLERRRFDRVVAMPAEDVAAAETGERVQDLRLVEQAAGSSAAQEARTAETIAAEETEAPSGG